MNLSRFQRIQAYIIREKAVCLMPFIALWLGLTLNSNWTPFWDSGIYISMGKSIAAGHGPKYMGYEGFKYPPGLPLMLALIILPFGYNFLLMRMLMVAFVVGSIWLAYLIVRDKSNRWMATGVMCSIAFSFPIVYECTRILSDLPYMFLSLLTIRWVERYARETDQWRSRLGYVTIALMLASYFTRIVGLTLFVGAIAYLTLGGTGTPRSRTNLKKAIAVGVILITVPPIWMAQNHLSQNKYPPQLRQGLSYEKELVVKATVHPNEPIVQRRDMIKRIKNNTKYYEGLLSNIISGKPQRSPTRAHIVTLILLMGYLLCVTRNRSMMEYYTFFYLLTYILWTAHQEERFLVPVIPFLFYYLFCLLEPIMRGIRWFIRRISQGEDQRKVIQTVATLALMGVFIQWNWTTDIRQIKAEGRHPYYSGRYAVLMDFVQWLMENTPDDAVVVSSDPAFAQLFFEKFAPRNETHRKTFDFPWIEDPAQVLAVMDGMGTDYVISVPTGKAKEYLHPVLKQYPERFEEVYRHQHAKAYVIYRVISN